MFRFLEHKSAGYRWLVPLLMARSKYSSHAGGGTNSSLDLERPILVRGRLLQTGWK